LSSDEVVEKLLGEGRLLVNIQNGPYPVAVRDAALRRMRVNVGVFRYLKEEKKR
jgi:hypothetical protein